MPGTARVASGAVHVAPRVRLIPAGVCSRPEPGLLALATVPSTAFGDGRHPTTRLCARAVDYWCRVRPPSAVLDVGTGTGVVARIARAHGVPFVAATDVDPTALEAARANAARDEARGELVISSDPPDAWGPRFDLVVANIVEEVLRELAPALAAALAPAGILVVSGFTAVQAPRLRVALAQRGLVPDAQADLEGWTLLQARRPAAERGPPSPVDARTLPPSRSRPAGSIVSR